MVWAASDRVLYDLDDCLQPTPQVAALFPMCMSHRLAILLDPRNPDGKDWTMLAELCGLSPECTRWVMIQRTSPTQKVLNIIAAKHGPSALSVLKEYLYQMGHGQALALLDSYETAGSDSESHTTTDQSDGSLTPTPTPQPNHRDMTPENNDRNDTANQTPTNNSPNNSPVMSHQLQHKHLLNKTLDLDDTGGSYSSESGYGSPTSTMPKIIVAADINPMYSAANGNVFSQA